MTTLLGEDTATGRRLSSMDLRVLASDIAQHALKKASAATYPVEDLEPVPAALRKAWTKEAGGMATLSEVARGIVRFRTLNLHGQWPMKGHFDVIFCRNVMIYFDREMQQRVVSLLERHLVPHGYLFISHSESLNGTNHGLRWVAPAVYQRSRP